MTRSLRKHLLSIGVGVSLVATGPVAPTHATQSGPERGLMLEHVRVFDPLRGTFTKPIDVLIDGPRIEVIGDLGTPGPRVMRIDAAGRYALPGLWDSHVHLSFLTLGGESAVATTLEAFVRNGITSVRDVGGPLDTIAAISRRVELGTLIGPRIYYAGPLLTGGPLLGHLEQVNAMLPGMAVVIASSADLDTILDRLVAQGARMTKAIDRWDPSLFRYYVRAAGARSLRVVLDPGVPILNPIPIDTALALGVTSIEHAQAAWAGVLRDDLRREVKVFMASGEDYALGEKLMQRIMALGEESVSRKRLAALADVWARKGAFFTPTLGHAESSLADNPPEAYRRPFEGRLAVGRLVVRELSARGVRLLVGQDQVEPDGTLKEMEMLARSGVRTLEVLRGVTIYPAQFFGLEDSVGTLAPGKRADIVILDANPLERIENIRSVWKVVQNGKVLPSATPKAGVSGSP